MSEQGAVTRNFRLTPAANVRADADDQLSIELDAIITIGRALSQIPDAETRTRVMRWAIERFGIDVAPPEEPGSDLALPANILPAPAPDAAAELLNVDGLCELFPADHEVSEPPDADFAASRAREVKRRKTTAADRLRGALHWMGV
jgi:hypothetical protein